MTLHKYLTNKAGNMGKGKKSDPVDIDELAVDKLSAAPPSHLFTKNQVTQLRSRCTVKTDNIFRLPEFSTPNVYNNGSFIYIDRGKPVLAVAHVDTVWDHGFGDDLNPHWKRSDAKIASLFRYNKDYGLVHSPSLDDRLGLTIINDWLPEIYGLEYDILITRDEEIGNSTAEDFMKSGIATHKYKWMFEFDRAGLDVPMYQFAEPKYESLLNYYGFEAGRGSFTDICYLDGLGVTGFNFGTAYYDAHSSSHYANLNELWVQMAKFNRFFREMESFHLVYTPAPPTNKLPTGSTLVPDSSACDLCGDYAEYFLGWDKLCEQCNQSHPDYFFRYEDADEYDSSDIIHDRLKSPIDMDLGLMYCDICNEENSFDNCTFVYNDQNDNTTVFCKGCMLEEEHKISPCSGCGRPTYFAYEASDRMCHVCINQF